MNGGLPAKYYFCIIHSHTYIYDSLELPFYDYQFISMYRVVSRTSIVQIIIYMWVRYIWTYNNFGNHTMFLFPHSVVVDYYIRFLQFFIRIASACCNTTKTTSRESPCGVTITETHKITATYLSQNLLHFT